VKKPAIIKHSECQTLLSSVRETINVINGKWKLMILISMYSGNKRFGEIEKSIPGISSKVLAKELKDLQVHKLIKRIIHDDYPVVVEYSLLPYADSLKKVIKALSDWGSNHRKKISGKQLL
jgi:DNA-binding HxlR family transcriptional regulator